MSSLLFIKRPILSIVISILITLCGIVALYNLPINQYPNISPPTIRVSATFPGANAETSAKVVASQIENQMNGVNGIIYMGTNTNSSGSTNIILTFDVGTDLSYSINDVLNRLYSAMPLLPDIVQKLGVSARISSPDMLLLATFYSDPYIDPKYVSNYLSRTVKNDLLLLPDIGNIAVFGSGSYAIRVWLDPNKMQRYAITVNDIELAIKDQNIENFVGRSNGAPEYFDSKLKVINITGRSMFTNSDQFANIILKNNGVQLIKLKDVAKVELGSNDYTTLASINFRDSKTGVFKNYPCTVMQIFLTPGANEILAQKKILERLNDDAKRFPIGLKYNIFIDNSRFVKASVTNVKFTLVMAFIFVALIILIFLKNWKASLIAVCTIIISIVGSLSLLYVVGYSLNTLSLFGMILATGIVVDDSIVILENIERLKNENKDMSLSEIISIALKELYGAVFAIVLVLSVVLVPAMALKGLYGAILRQFTFTIACSVVISGISAVTFTPAVYWLVMRNSQHQKKITRSKSLLDLIIKKYLNIAKWLIYHKKTTMLIWCGIIFVTVLLVKMIPLGFIPNEDQGLIFASMNLPSSNSLTQTSKKVNSFINEITKNPAVLSVISIAGFDFLDTGNLKTYAASFFISLKDWSERSSKSQGSDSIINNINKRVQNIKGVTIRAFNQPPIRGMNVTGGFEFILEDRLNGNPVQLKIVADKLIERLKKFKQVNTAFQTLDTNNPQTEILPDVDRALSYGVNLKILYDTIQTIYSNNNVNFAYNMQDLIWVIMQAEYDYRKDVDKLRNIYINGNNGNLVPISSVVRVTQTRGPNVLQKFNGYLATKVTIIPSAGITLGDISIIVEKELNGLDKSYGFDYIGTSYQLKHTQLSSLLGLLFSVIMMYLVLCALYEMWRLPLVVLMGFPIALFGAFLVLLISMQPNDLYFQISLLTLLGLSAKNIILLVEFALQHFNKGNSLVNSAIYALKVRFRPILMTSCVFIAGTTPLVLATGAGANAQHSVGYGIIGGVLGSVIFATLLTPAFFVYIMKNYKKYNIIE